MLRDIREAGMNEFNKAERWDSAAQIYEKTAHPFTTLYAEAALEVVDDVREQTAKSGDARRASIADRGQPSLVPTGVHSVHCG
jgi:hypothetical protein